MGHNNVKSLDYRSAVKDTDEWPSKYSKLFIEVSIVILFLNLWC